MSELTLRRSFIFLCIIGLFSYFSYNLVRTPVLPLFAQELGAAPQLIGLVVAASTITGIFLKLPSGIIADLMGRRVILFIGVVIFSIMPFVYIVVQKVGLLIAVRSIHGLATALFAPVAMAVVADLYPKNRGEYLGWYSSSTQVGKLLGPMAGGFLLGMVGFSNTFLICGLLGIIPLLLVIRIPVGHKEGHEPVALGRVLGRFGQEFRSVTRDRRVLVTSAMEAAQMVAAGALMAFLPIYGIQAGLSPAQVGFLFGIQGVAALISKPLMGRMSDQTGRKPLIVFGLLGCAVTFTLIPTTASFPLLLILAAGFGVGEAIVITSTAALVADLYHDKSLGSAMGVFGTIMDIGHASGPILAGVLIAAFGYLIAFSLIGLILVAALTVFVITLRN